MDDFAKGLFTAMSEFGQPFISESIWTEAVTDLLVRGGRTRDGFEVYSEQDNDVDTSESELELESLISPALKWH